jgi:hypothetical protein
MKQLEVPWLRRWLMWSAVSWATIVSSIYPGPSKPTVRTWLARLILGVPALALLLALLTLGPGPLLRPLWPHGQILRLLTIAAGVGVAALWVMVAGVVALGRADRLSTYLVAVLITAVASPLLAAGAAISLLFLLYVVVEEIATGCNGLRKWHDLYDESPRAKRIAAIRKSH